MLSYVYFGTNNLDKAIAFYSATLAPLDMQRCVTGDSEWDRIAAGWGVYEAGGSRELAFWIGIPYDAKPASMHSMWPRWPLAVHATVPLGFGCTTQPIFMPPMCAIQTATRWRPCVAATRRDFSR